MLSAYGIPVLPTRRAMHAEDAVAAATLLGYPVTLRLCAAAATETRGDLHDAEELRHAAGVLARRAPALAGPGFLVQRQIGRARAFAILIAEDAMFGPTIGLGASGAAPGAFALDLPPLNLPLAQALVATAGLPDPALNHAAVAETLVRVSQLLIDFPAIGALRIDPLFVDAEGVMAGDARLTLRPPDAPAVLAILPYPAELQTVWEGSGERLLIRPIRPEDAEAHAAFFRRLSPEDVRFRFFSSMRQLAAEQVAHMTQVDYAREMAFIAVREATGETVGVARLVREMDTPVAEFAVVVEPAMQHRGLAGELMRRLIAWGRQEGIGEIVGDILADNAGMIAFVRRLGFLLVRRKDEEGVLEARLSLAPEAND
jgi:acetyltransferase